MTSPSPLTCVELRDGLTERLPNGGYLFHLNGRYVVMDSDSETLGEFRYLAEARALIRKVKP